MFTVHFSICLLKLIKPFLLEFLIDFKCRINRINNGFYEIYNNLKLFFVIDIHIIEFIYY
jgi:hypothetical protein